MKKLVIYILLSLTMHCPVTVYGQSSGREFRGAWMHTVYQSQYARQSAAQNKRYLCRQLDSLQVAGINAVIFQVRPSADAFYASRHEPWSRFLAGKAGEKPNPYWDPLRFMVDECHERGMELHAWINPYRVTTSRNERLPEGHIALRHPERFVKYGGKLYFNPGLPENRRFIADVVADIIDNYDVDGIHTDDYFYPYPVKGDTFDDAEAYHRYGDGMSLGDWRRANVDSLISELHALVMSHKPWVRFGVSPFGIWRNKSSDAKGSDTNGLQNYDDLYADVLLWSRNGWVDYLMPQLYWSLENKRASYLTLVDWWGRNARDRHVYIGQDIAVTMKTPDLSPGDDPTQLHHKVRLTRENSAIQGNCWWPAYSISANVGGIADSLAATVQSSPVLPPSYPWISENRPRMVKKVSFTTGLDGRKTLTWHAPKSHKNTPDEVNRYAIYSVPAADGACLTLIAVVPRPGFVLPAGFSGDVLITSVTRVNNESDPVRVTIK